VTMGPLTLPNPQELYTHQLHKTKNHNKNLDLQALGKNLLAHGGFAQKVGLLFKKSRNKTLGRVLEKVQALRGLSDNSPLHEKVKQFIKLEDIKSEVFQAGFVSLKDGQYYSMKQDDFTSNEALQNAVL